MVEHLLVNVLEHRAGDEEFDIHAFGDGAANCSGGNITTKELLRHTGMVVIE